jgi:hypothetical protein
LMLVLRWACWWDGRLFCAVIDWVCNARLLMSWKVGFDFALSFFSEKGAFHPKIQKMKRQSNVNTYCKLPTCRWKTGSITDAKMWLFHVSLPMP